jgi:hypothetical protein
MSSTESAAEQESLRDLATRVIENGKAYAHAELTVIKETVATKAGVAGPAAALVIIAILIVQAAITVLAASLGLLLAPWLGLPGGFAVAALIWLALAGLLVWIAAARFKRAFK